MPNIVPVIKSWRILAGGRPSKASKSQKSGHGALAVMSAKSSSAPSTNKQTTTSDRVHPKPGTHIKNTSSNIHQVASIRKVVSGGSGNHLRAKLSSNLKITKPTGTEPKVGSKRAHAEVSDSKISSAELTGAPKPKKAKMDSAGHDADYSKKAMDLRKHEEIFTAAEFADWCFRADASGFVLSREMKKEVCNNLTVPGSTTETYMTNLVSSHRFKEVAKRAYRILKGEEPVDDTVVITFILADSISPVGPASKSWVTAQLVVCLGLEATGNWRKIGIYRGYKRLLRYLQGCRNGEHAFDPDLGTVLLRKARAGEGYETTNPFRPTTEPTTPTAVKLELLEQAPGAIGQAQQHMHFSGDSSLPTHIRMDKAADAPVASGASDDNALE